VTFIDFLTLVVLGQCQADAVYFDLSNACDFVPYNTLLYKLSSFEFSEAYVSWFRSYLNNSQSGVRVSGTLSVPFHVMSGVPQSSILGLFFSTYLLMIYATLLTIVNFKFLPMISKFSASLTHHMITSYFNQTFIP
jgi:hypothetical protein